MKQMNHKTYPRAVAFAVLQQEIDRVRNDLKPSYFGNRGFTFATILLRVSRIPCVPQDRIEHFRIVSD